MTIIDGHNEPEGVSLNVEDDPIGSDDAGVSVGTRDIGGVFPVGARDLVKPSVQRGLYGSMVLAASQRIHKNPQRLSGNDPHEGNQRAITISF